MEEETDDDSKKKDREKGNLHTQEEFAKAKRNALWLCSLAVLLWLVHIPEGGDIQAPMLGTGTKVSAYWLRVLVWVASIYCVIGFWRQARNVDRMNSQLLYTEQFANIDERLGTLSGEFRQLAEQCTRLNAQAANVNVLPPADIDGPPSRLSAKIRESAERFRAQLRQGAVDVTGGGALRAWDKAEKEFQESITEEFRALTHANNTNANELAGVASIGANGVAISQSVLELSIQFNRLSQRIRGEHRFLYTWYDKYLTYFMFLVATAVTWWERLPSLLPRLNQEALPTMDSLKGFLTSPVVVTGLLVFAVVAMLLFLVSMISRLVFAMRYARMTIAVPPRSAVAYLYSLLKSALPAFFMSTLRLQVEMGEAVARMSGRKKKRRPARRKRPTPNSKAG